MRVLPNSPLWDQGAACGGAGMGASSCDSPARLLIPHAARGLAAVLARVGRRAWRSMDTRISRSGMDPGVFLRIHLVEASPLNVHGIVHVAPSMSRPLRAASGGLRPAWTSSPATRSAARTRGWPGEWVCVNRVV